MGDSYLYAGSRVLSAQAAGQGPAAGGDVRHFGNGLHLLRAADTHLKGGKPQTISAEQQRNDSRQEVVLAGKQRMHRFRTYLVYLRREQALM